MDHSRLVEFGNLELLAKQVVEGFITGMHKSPLHGFSVEFAEHRIYNQGESTRHVDWKLYGRTDRLYTKKYEEETNLRCQMVIDCSPSMYFPVDQRDNKLTFSMYAVVSLIELLKRQRDAYGISLFHESLMLHTAAKSSPLHQRYIYAELEKFFKSYSPTKNSFTHISNALNEVAQTIPKRGMVMVFTDLWSNGEDDDIMNALSHLKHHHHEVVVFHLYSRHFEEEFSLENRPYVLVDMESGEELRMLPNEFKNQYKDRYKKGLNDLKIKCGDLAVDFVPLAIEDGYHDVLIRYLLKRQSML